MGLKHEHQRVDRDHCVTVSEARLNGPLALCLCVRDPRGRTMRFRVRHALRPDRVDPTGNPSDVGSAVSAGHRRGGEDAREASGIDDDLDEPARPGGHCRRATRRDSSAVRLEPGQPAYPRGTLLADPGAESLLVRTLARRGLQPAHRNGRSGIHLDRGELHRAARHSGRAPFLREQEASPSFLKRKTAASPCRHPSRSRPAPYRADPASLRDGTSRTCRPDPGWPRIPSGFPWPGP